MQKGANNPLMRKVGPLPVYAYALAALAVWFLFLRGSSAKASSGLPYTGAEGASSAAQQPASGQGSPADNGNADLLSALGSNALSVDALLSALQQGGGFGVTGGTGTSGGNTSGGGASTASTTAPTIDSGTNNAPVDTVIGTQAESNATGLPIGTPQVDPGFYNYVSGVDPAALLAASAQRDAENFAALGVNAPTRSLAIASPTPTVVQPAPVDTSSVIAPAPTILKPGATNVMA